MVNLSDNLSNLVKEKLNKEIDVTEFTEQELGEITTLSLSKNDIQYLNYFKNIQELDVNQFPSIDEKDIEKIAECLPNIKVLRIKEQSALINLNLSGFSNLEKLELIYNDNLVSVSGARNLKQIVFYDNKDFVNIQQIVDLVLNSRGSEVTLDIVYYAGLLRCLHELDEDTKMVDNFNWIESVGLRKHVEHIYTAQEVKTLSEQLTDIISKYLYVTDGEIEKFGILYYWMVHNIDFINEDDPKDADLSVVSNIYNVFLHSKGGRLSFAKAFQLLLSFAGVQSSVVYSLGALDTIGYYNGQQVYSLLGTSDYALLRVNIDNRYYYCDIAWDSMVSTYKYFDELRLLLVSKDELKIRHKFVGEGNIVNSYSYHGDDSDDLIMFAEDRIKNVLDVLNDIERYKASLVGAEMNCSIIQKTIIELRKKIDSLDNNEEEYKAIKEELVKNENDLVQEETELLKLNNQRTGVIESYSSYLGEHYIVSNNDKVKMLEELDERRKMLLVSNYMYDILSKSI